MWEPQGQFMILVEFEDDTGKVYINPGMVVSIKAQSEKLTIIQTVRGVETVKGNVEDVGKALKGTNRLAN